MSLDQCIASLPRVEKGAIRDIFSPIPTRPEPFSLNLTQEYSRFSHSASDTKGSGSTTTTTTSTTGSSSRTPSRSTPPPQQPQQSSSDGRFNCGPCKKSFGSEATFHSHQMSAKHIATVKDAEKKNKGKGQQSKSGGSNNNKNSNNKQQRAQEEEEQQDSPEVTEALTSFRKVEKIVKENPNMAASVLWKIAKGTVMIQSAHPMFAPTASPPQAGALTPTQISMTLYLSRLSMARLVVYHSPSLAAQYYLDAIQGRWQIPPEEIQHICEMINTSSQAQILAHAKAFLSTHSKTEKLMQPPTPAGSELPAKKPADPNLKLLTILLEAASLIAQPGSMINNNNNNNNNNKGEDRVLAETALGLLALALNLAEASEDRQGVIDIFRTIAVIYKSSSIKVPSGAASSLIRAGELGLDQAVMGAGTIVVDQERHQLCVVWDVFQALLLSIETGDFVRIQQSIRLLRRVHEIVAPSFQDVEAVIEIAQAVLAQDNDFLHCDAAFSIEHLLLLVGETENQDKELLLCRYSTPTLSTIMLERLQQLIK
ncbi:hypothetical protein BGZ83_003128 [Gryganskiella cystojenkinii]|nr:hypothetical protein BGZ83_003128 [Gryganskiella cystojenkinii]